MLGSDMPKSPFFTIITATYNAERVLPSLLESLAAQTCRDFVWLVQDGGSKDGTQAVIEQGRSRLPAVSMESAPDRGIYDAWNKALDRAQGAAQSGTSSVSGDELGQWVLFLGADDALADAHVLTKAEQQLRGLDPSVLYAVGGVTLFTAGGQHYGEFPADIHNAAQRLRREMVFCHTGVFHSSTVFQENRFDPGYYSLGDYDFFCRTLHDDSQAVRLEYTITHMALGGVSTRLCSQPRIFYHSVRIARKHFGTLTRHHWRVGCTVAVVWLLCRLLGPERAERAVDATRRWRGKTPCWHQPASGNGPVQILPCPTTTPVGEKPLVSIVTVCRNAEKTIARTIASVAAQMYPHLEYIIIDGGSSDGTVKIIKDSPAVTQWISEPDEGIADAFNKGIALARGEWIGIINADDWYEAGAVEIVVAKADEADVVHGPVQYWEQDTPREVYHPDQRKLFWEMTINHPSMFVRRAAYVQCGGFDPAYRYAMDYELALRLMTGGIRFCAVDQVVAHMRYGGASDKYWWRAALECAQAKAAHLHKPLSSYGYFCWQLFRGLMRRGMERLRLYGLIRWFRQHTSIIRKSS